MCSYPRKFFCTCAQQGLRDSSRPPSGLVLCIFLVPKTNWTYQEGRQFTQFWAPLGAFFVLSAISNWTSSAYCAPHKELKICLWNLFWGAAIYVSPYAAKSFKVSFWVRAICVCWARISHISPGIYIKTLYEIIKHSGRASSHHTPHTQFDSVLLLLLEQYFE